jgi:hypothetical protein
MSYFIKYYNYIFGGIIRYKYIERFNGMSYFWSNTSILNSKSYTCGYCNNSLASNVGFFRGGLEDGRGDTKGEIYICHHCYRPTFFDAARKQTPGIRPGGDVNGITDNGVKNLYTEARDAYSKNAFTATVLSCRKLLMHVAVDKGAAQNLNFLQYVEYLSDENYIPPASKGWVDHIRQKGNEANHEITIMTEEEAKNLLSFVEMLLKIIYEFPNKIPTTTPSSTP